jgi:hypothetical protein
MNRDRDRRHHGERTPRRAGQGLHDDQRQHREDDDHDHEGAEQGDDAGDLAHLGLDQVAKRTAVAAHRQEQHHEVLHGAGEHDTGQDPQHAGQIAHLRGEHGADQRAGAGDRGEVVAEQHVAVRRHVVEAVVVFIGRGLATGVEAHHLLGDIQAVEAVRDQVDADGRDDDPDRVDGFAALEGDVGERGCAYERKRSPSELACETFHVDSSDMIRCATGRCRLTR